MNETPSARINNLIAALCDNPLPPTPDEIRSAMKLAYYGGKIDGALEALTKMLANKV